VYEKYFRVMARGVPPEAVKHMMVKEGVDPAVLDCDPNLPLPDAFSPYTNGPPLKQDPVYEKFFKVRSLGHGMLYFVVGDVSGAPLGVCGTHVTVHARALE
jgi:hypothetical protein